MRERFFILDRVSGIRFAIVAVFGLLFFVFPQTAWGQTRCVSGQQYCVSGPYGGTCQATSRSCPTGSVEASVGGCAACACPTGSNGRVQVVCGNTCVNDTRGDVCQSGAGVIAGNACAPTCQVLPPEPVVLSPGQQPQQPRAVEGGSPTVSWNRRALDEGSILSLSQGASRSFAVNKTGVQIGLSPVAQQNGLDLSAGNHKNLIYGIAKEAVDSTNSLLKLEVQPASGRPLQRFRVDGSGNVEAGGKVTGIQLRALGDVIVAPSATGEGSVKVYAPGNTSRYAGIWYSMDDQRPGAVVSDSIGLPDHGIRITQGQLSIGGGQLVLNDSRKDREVILRAKGNAGSSDSRFRIESDGSVAIILNADGTTGSIGTFQVGGPGIPLFSVDRLGNTKIGGNAALTGKVTVGSSTASSASLEVADERTAGPWLVARGGGGMLENTALRLYDEGTASGNQNRIEFAQNNNGPVGVARVTSESVGARALSGAKLKLETASNNTGTWNANQLVLDRTGNVGIGASNPDEKLEIAGSIKISGSRIKNASGYGLVETDRTDWLRINPDQEYPKIAMYKPVALGTGGLAIGEWVEQVSGLRVRDDDNDTTADIAQFFANNLTQGIGIGYNRIEAVGSNANQDIILVPKGTGGVGIGTSNPDGNLHVNANGRDVVMRVQSEGSDFASAKVVLNRKSSVRGALVEYAVDGALQWAVGTGLYAGGQPSPAFGIATGETYADARLLVTAAGDVLVKGDSANSTRANVGYDCVNVGNGEIRCNLRDLWRDADRLAGYVHSWRGSQSCTDVCAAAGLRSCTETQSASVCGPPSIQPTSWSATQNCATVKPYREAMSTVSVAGRLWPFWCVNQSPIGFSWRRCKCAS